MLPSCSLKRVVSRWQLVLLLLLAGFIIVFYRHFNCDTTSPGHITLSHILPPFKGDNPQHFLDVISVFPLLETEEFSKSRYADVSKTAREEREKEYIYCLKRNLDHPAVATLHLFSHKPNQLFDKLKNQYGVNLTKAVFYKSTGNPTYEEMFVYASRFLRGRFVFILNADNYIGEGFTKLDLVYLRSSKIMYSLTRRVPIPVPPKCGVSFSSNCDGNSSYIGSHDAFLFYLQDSPFPSIFLKELSFPTHVYGSENVLIWAFQNVLKYSVLNPCKILHIHHMHCSPLRAHNRARVNNDNKTGMAGFTDSLYISHDH